MSDEETQGKIEGFCLNCDTPLEAEFCKACGQASSTQRYTFRSLLDEIYSQFRKIEVSKTLITSIALFTRPGPFVREYLAGKRVGFINPVRFFFLGFLIEITVKLSTSWILPEQHIVVHNGMGFELLNFGLTIVWGILWAILYHRDDLTFIEYIIASIYFVSQTFILSAIWFLLMLPFVSRYPSAELVSSTGDLIIYFIYSCAFAYSLFNTKFLSLVWKQLLILTIFVAVVFGVVYIGGLSS